MPQTSLPTNPAKMPESDFRRARAAVSAVFFANGLAIGCWAILVPVVIRNLGISESDMGLIILAGGSAAIIALAFSPATIAWAGIRNVILAAGIILSPALYFILHAGSFLIAAILLMFVMAGLATQDVAMNADAAELETASGRNIMSAFHGFWSAGAMVGALIGGPFLAYFGSDALAITIGAVAVICAIAASPFLSGRQQMANAGQMPRAMPRKLLPWLMGMIAFAGFVSEGAVIDWSAHYFRTELDSGVTLSGLAFGAFSLTMMIARLTGDRMRNRLGDFRLFVISVLIATTGLGFVSLAPSAELAALGFALAGLGNANMVPIAFSAASRIPGLAKGTGIAAVTFCGYAGLLFAPASLGIVGEHFGFSTVFAMMALLIFATLLLAPRLKPRQA